MAWRRAARCAPPLFRLRAAHYPKAEELGEWQGCLGASRGVCFWTTLRVFVRSVLSRAAAQAVLGKLETLAKVCSERKCAQSIRIFPGALWHTGAGAARMRVRVAIGTARPPSREFFPCRGVGARCMLGSPGASLVHRRAGAHSGGLSPPAPVSTVMKP